MKSKPIHHCAHRVLPHAVMNVASGKISGGDRPQGAACPEDRPIKGNQGQRAWIYHRPGQEYYGATTPEACFANAEEAEAAGYRASKK